MFSKKISYIVLIFITFFLFLSCSSKKSVAPQNPILKNIRLDFIHNYADSMKVSIEVAYPQAGNEIDSVWGILGFMGLTPVRSELVLNDNGLNGDSIAGDGRYTVSFSDSGSQFLLGFYNIRIRAIDNLGNLSAFYDTLFLTSDGINPILYNVVAPDSLRKGSPDTSYIYISAYDPDGHSDIDSVYFISTRPDSSSNGMHFSLRDDGLYGDKAAGDSVYTVGFLAPGISSLSGIWTFTYYAKDLNGNTSNHPFAYINVY